MPQQVGVHVMRFIALTKIRTRIEGLYTHFLHVTLDSFAVNSKPELHVFDVISDASRASGGSFGMDSIDQMLDPNFLFRWLRVLPVKACPIHRKQIRLVFDSQVCFT
jgi:hypothetical protein